MCLPLDILQFSCDRCFTNRTRFRYYHQRVVRPHKVFGCRVDLRCTIPKPSGCTHRLKPCCKLQLWVSKSAYVYLPVPLSLFPRKPVCSIVTVPILGNQDSLAYKIYAYWWVSGVGPTPFIRWCGPFGSRYAQQEHLQEYSTCAVHQLQLWVSIRLEKSPVTDAQITPVLNCRGFESKFVSWQTLVGYKKLKLSGECQHCVCSLGHA